MSTHLTPEGFRTAAYLEARARLDARKTRGVVKCTPPNTKCGNRCIPPEWDCRIKGEGSDPLLAAKRTDPISGIANFERGFNRFGRFARTGSFSELESSKNSFVRGAVKLKPGNLKDKKEFEQWLKENYAKIAVPLFVAGGLMGSHAILKKGDVFGYRRGVGQKIDNAVSTGISAVLDVVPVVGQARAHTRRRAAAAAKAVQQRSRGLVNLRETMNSAPAELIPETPISSTLIKGNSALTRALNNVNTSSSTTSFYDWNLKHQQAFWGASHSRKPMAEDERFLAGRSIYAEPAAQAYINDAWQLNLPTDATRIAYINTLAQKYTIEAEAYLQLAKQQGFRVYGRPGAEYVHRDDRPDFIKRNVRNISDPQIQAAQSEFIAASISGLSPTGRARRRYQVITATFDNYYKGVAKSLTEVAGVPAYDPDVTSLSPVRAAAERRRIDYMMQTAPARITRKTSAGPAHDRLFLKDYYHTKVAGNERSTYTLSNSEAIRAATELSGNEIRTSTEAIELLQQNGYRNARLEVRRNPFQTRRSSTSRQAPPPEGGRPARRRRIPDAQVIKDYMAAGFTQAEAEAFLARLKEQRGDSPEDGITAYELAYLIAQSRQDKRCGKSGIPETRKCSKPTPAQSEEARLRAEGAANPGVTCRPGMQQCGKICIPQNTTCHLQGSGSTAKLSNNIGKGALLTGAIAAGAVLSNKRMRKRIILNTQKTRLAAKRTLRATDVFTRRQRVLADRQVRRAFILGSKKTVDALSTEDVKNGLSRLPAQYQETARKLVGRAKTAAAGLALNAEGYKVQTVDVANNFTTFRNKKGSLISVGSYGDSLVTYYSNKSHTYGKKDVYIIGFNVDQDYDATRNMPAEQASAITRGVRKMTNDQLSKIDNGVLATFPWDGDEYGQKRRRIYNKMGFNDVMGEDSQWALVENGKIKKMNQMDAFLFEAESGANASPITKPVREKSDVTRRIEIITRLLRERDENGRPKYTRETAKREAERQIAESRRSDVYEQVKRDVKEAINRAGKPCGKSFIPKNAKCSKPTTAQYTEKPNTVLTKAAQVAGGVAATGAVAVLIATGLTKQKRDVYRRNVPKSALEAEKLALEYERQFREQASVRLGKRPQDVTGFEASTYNYKDKGYDRGFGGFDNNPEYFGQTPSSRGAVVMLSYADDGKDTRRGQGGFKLATNGVFKEIWGEHDILPFANNISQPNVKTPDDLTIRNRTQTTERIRGVAGELGERAYKTAYTVKDLSERFAYLRENVDKRGFNPDAIRVAAFVVAQRRLTGKPVDIMSYSNGGNVATEALEILKEMGYRDVKVVNVAGPTFGMFEHSRDNMRTWLSEGDEFYKYFGNNAFQGSNAKLLDNDKIPHGIMDAIDPNNKEFGGDAAADNRRARRSYMLDEQLRKEAYTFLTVDRKRSGELVDEIVWRVSDKKPFEGDLQALFGDNSQAKAQEYTSLLTQSNKEQAKQHIQDEIEDRMIEVWYGGYNSSRIKNRAKALRREVAAQATRSSTPRSRRPIPLYERVARIRKANPDLSREAAMRQARKEMREAT